MKVLDVPSSGSINYKTASRNRNGQYLRARAIPVQPRSTAQLAVRGYMVNASQAWRALTKAQQAAWTTYGANHPRSDALGQSSAPTGAQAHAGINTNLQLAGLAMVTVPPADPDFSAFVPGALTSTALSLTVTGFVRPTSGQIQFWATRPCGNGRNYFGKPTYIMTTTGASTSPLNIASQVAARFGTLAVGMVLQITQIPVTNGVKGSREVAQVTIAT